MFTQQLVETDVTSSDSEKTSHGNRLLRVSGYYRKHAAGCVTKATLFPHPHPHVYTHPCQDGSFRLSIASIFPIKGRKGSFQLLYPHHRHHHSPRGELSLSACVYGRI